MTNEDEADPGDATPYFGEPGERGEPGEPGEREYVPPYFGELDAPVADDGIQVPTPVGEKCVHCPDLIAEGDKGTFVFLIPDPGEEGNGPAGRLVPVHQECSIRNVMGPFSHTSGPCRCHVDPPPLENWRIEGSAVDGAPAQA